MNSRTHISRILTCIVALLLIAANASAEVTTRLSSRFLARGEQALLQIIVTEAKPTRFPEIEPIKGVRITPAGRGPRTSLVPGRQIEYIFEYTLSSYETGDHTIPSVPVEAGGNTFATEPLDFSIFNPDELQWSEATIGDVSFRYATTFKVLNSNPYIGENIPVEIKVFVPRDLFVVDWGIPDFERDGITAWRMQPSAMRSQMNLLGMPYISAAYPSTLAPTRTGKVAIGPAKIRLTASQVSTQGILRRVHATTHLEVPTLELNSLPLPPNAPSGFDNAIGNFKINITTPSTEVTEGDPIPLVIQVSGSGNLDTLKAPIPVNSLGWKIYEPAREQRADERRTAEGSVTFNQFIRPLELKGEIPAFKLAFFNPRTRSYESVSSRPIPLQMTPNSPTTTPQLSGPPPAATTPVEQMTDILGLIPQAAVVQPKRRLPTGWWLHLSGGILAALLIAKALWTRNKHRLHKDPTEKALKKDLRKLEQSTGNDHEFLMAAGRFVEQWLATQPDDAVRQILNDRDSLCFRKDASTQTTLETGRRKAILRTLRKAATTATVILLAMLATVTRANADDATKAYESARYDTAIQTWLDSAPYNELSADTLYHIGNACYRSGSPGYAALYYRRALARNPDHHESRQNLRFIERKYGTISIKRPDYQYTLAKLPLAFWKNTTWAGLWICAVALLVFPATHTGARLRAVAIVGLLLAPLVTAGGALGWRYFPEDAAFSPILSQAIIIDDDATIYTDASRTANELIQAPPGSICEIIHSTGEWSYVALATHTRGWVLSASIRKVIPDKAPAPPKIRKPQVDETSA